MTAYPPECYTDAEVAAGRAADERAAAANEADAAIAREQAIAEHLEREGNQPAAEPEAG